MVQNKHQDFLLNIKTIYANQGIKQFFIHLVHTVFKQFVAIGYTYRIDLDEIKLVPSNKGLTTQIMTLRDLDLIYLMFKDELNENLYKDFSEKLKDSRFEGFIVKRNDEICGYYFINYKNTDPVLKEKYVDLEKNGYLLTQYVFQKYRGQKIQQFFLYDQLKLLKNKNFRTATIMVSKYNYSSVRSIEKIGFKKCVRLCFFRFNGLFRSRVYFKVL
jgi:hypothetical protein